MGSGEEDDGAEEAQEDSSPIELDWVCSPHQGEQMNTKKKTTPPPFVTSSTEMGEGLVHVFRGVLFWETTSLPFS